MSDIRAAQFTISQIATATGVSAPAIRQWYDRGIITLGNTDRKPDENGLARLLSGQTALMIAIMGRLTKSGISTVVAQKAGALFAFTGTDGERNSGFLFPQGETAVVIRGDVCRVVNVHEGTLLNEVLSDARRPMIPVLVFVIDELVDELRVGLGLGRDPLEPVSRVIPPVRAPRSTRRR